nr:DUF2459 domain-containing protein [Akkermansiaceae bacterium]
AHIERVPVRLENPPASREKEPHVLVWLVADKYHTGMVFPYDWLIESGFIPPEGFGNPKFVTMSWGNRNAYSKEGIDTKWKMFRVLFTPTPSVMEMIPANYNIAEVCPHQRIWRKLVERRHGPKLADFLNKCSVKDASGRPVVVCESSWGKGVQLESSHSYFIPRVCNVWTVQTIECLGGDINPWLALTADGLIRSAEQPPNDFEQIWPGGGMPPSSIRNP